EETSVIESEFRSLGDAKAQVRVPSPKALKQFGYALFSQPVSTFAPVDNVPVDPNYVVGPGDELNVMMWGRVSKSVSLTVQRDGSLQIPDIGPLQVASLTFTQAKKLIETNIGQITGVQVSVTMGRIRTIQIFVIGKVPQPGLYTVSALSHVSNALVAAGGISKIGSLRKIELRRGNRTIKTIDLYAMLLHGDTSADLELQQGDVIFVPVIGPVVGVAGDVKDPAIYELKGDESLTKVLAMAGGVGAFGYGQRLQVERIDNHQRRVALDVALAEVGQERFAIRDGDLIEVFEVLPERNNIVTVAGNIHRPGPYEWRGGMRVSDLVREGEGVADRTYFAYAVIERVEGADQRVHFVPVDLGAALSTTGLPSQDVTLQPRDKLTIFSEYDLQDLPQVTVAGAVRKPGGYALLRGMRVSDLIYEAGGLKREAYLESAQLSRSEVVKGQRARFLHQDIDLRQAMEGQTEADPLLQPGDELLVEQASNWHGPWAVKLEGQVMRPGPYAIGEHDRLASLLERAGGLRTDAYLPAAVLIRQSVKETEQKRLDQTREQLKSALIRFTLVKAQSEETSDATKSAKAEEFAKVEQLLGNSEGQQAVGRVVLHLSTIDGLVDSYDNVVLENADEIVVPRRPEAIPVLGQVYNPSSIVYEPGKTVRDYLQKAGGPTEWADTEHIMVIRAGGDVLTEKGMRESGRNGLFPLLPAISGGLMGSNLERGDTVYVP
ncbi:MAG TPA: SLBB domain-containing protein, partial [Isosphaeraceae bacterium]|nr:SLBB domain-containing protein [Isosphaeraceae bacterium]